MQIRTFEEIRQNYHTIAELCKETAEPVFLTKDGHTVDEVSAYLVAVIAVGAAISGEK